MLPVACWLAIYIFTLLEFLNYWFSYKFGALLSCQRPPKSSTGALLPPASTSLGAMLSWVYFLYGTLRFMLFVWNAFALLPEKGKYVLQHCLPFSRIKVFKILSILFVDRIQLKNLYSVIFGSRLWCHACKHYWSITNYGAEWLKHWSLEWQYIISLTCLSMDSSMDETELWHSGIVVFISSIRVTNIINTFLTM